MKKRYYRLDICIECGKEFSRRSDQKQLRCSRECYEKYRSREIRGEKHWAFKKETYENGLKFIDDNGKKIPEYRYLLKKYLTRPFHKNEVVHHIDGVQTNNDLNNLLICDRSSHRWLHNIMSYLFQVEHFNGYPIWQDKIMVLFDKLAQSPISDQELLRHSDSLCKLYFTQKEIRNYEIY